MAQSRARATVPDYNPYGSSQISTNTSNSISRPSFNRPQPIDLRKSKYTQTTYNENYPGLNESSYKKLEAAVEKMGFSGEEKRTAMDQWYRNNVKYLLNDQTLEERAKEINEQAYQAAELKNPEADAQLRMTEFSQALKKKYNLDATADDLEVFNTFVSDLGEEGVNLAGQYLAGENKKLRYDAGLETFGEKAEDFGVGVLQSPGKRGYNLFGQLFDRAGKWIGEGTANMLTDEQKEKVRDWLDKNTIFKKDRIDEYAQSLAQQEAEGNTFNGRENTDIRTPLLGEERANSTATKVGETVGDIGTAIAFGSAMGAPLTPLYADSTVLGAGVLGAGEGALGTALTHLGTEGNLDISPTEAALGIGGGILGGELTRYLANLPKNQVENIRKEASSYIEKSIKPTVKGKQSQADYNKFIDDTLDVVHKMNRNKEILQYTDDAGEVVRGKMPTNLRETSETLGNLKKVIYNQYNDIAKKAGDAGARVDMNKAFNQLDDLTKDISQNISNPGTKAIVDNFKNTLLEYTDDAGTIAIDDAQKITQDFNQQLTAFFKNPNMNDVSKSSIIAKLNKWTKDAINDSIDDALSKGINKGSTMSQQYNQLKGFYSKIKTIEDEIAKRALVDARKNAKGLSTTVLDSLAGGEFTEALLTVDPVKLGKAGVMKVISKYYNYLNNPNTQLRNLFNLVEKVDNPTALQTAKSTIGNSIRSTAQDAAPIFGAIYPGYVGGIANELTND